MDVVTALLRQGGVARRITLLKSGISRRHIEEASAAERIERHGRGIYAVADPDPTLLSALCAGAELACISAAKQLGLWILREPLQIHVSVDHGRALSGQFRIHRSPKPLKPADICVQAMRCLLELDALCIVESAVVKRLVTLAALRALATGARDGPLRHIASLVDPHAQSILETAARYRLQQAGLSVKSQVHIPGVGRLDLFVEGVLGIEADGREYHSGAREFEEDRRRWNLLTVRGTPVLRLSSRLILGRPETFVELVQRVLDNRESQ